MGNLFIGENKMLNSDDIRSIIKKVVIGVNLSDLDDNQDFADAGIDSLDQLSILLGIEEQYGVTIPDEDLDQCNSIAGLVLYINKK